MELIKKIFLYFKKLFYKENEIKMLDEPKKIVNSCEVEKQRFLNSLRVDLEFKKKKPIVETLICIGDGLGIQNKKYY